MREHFPPLALCAILGLASVGTEAAIPPTALAVAGGNPATPDPTWYAGLRPLAQWLTGLNWRPDRIR